MAAEKRLNVRPEEEIRLALCSAGEIYGGVEQFIYTYALYLRSKTSINFIIVLFNRGLLFEKLREAGFEPYVLQWRFRYDVSVIKHIVRLFRERKINMIHTHGYKATIPCAIAARWCNIRIVKTEHGLIEHSKGMGRVKMSLNLWLDEFCTRHFLDGIVFVSGDIHKSRQQIYPAIKQYQIYNGISPIEGGLTADNELERDNFNIGIVGRICEVKGHMHLLRALKSLGHLERLRLYIFGQGPLEERCRKYCERNGLDRIVFFMGFKKDIHDYMKRLDLLVMPSSYEGLPYTILEAMFLKVPVLASNVGGLKEILVSHEDGVLVPAGDEEALARSIEELYRSESLRKSLAQSGYKKVCNHFLISRMAEKYVEVYVEALSGAQNA